MSVSIFYSAIPVESSLYQRLQTERALLLLMERLFPYGKGIFHFFEIEPAEVDEILSDVIEGHQNILGSESETTAWIDEFREEIRRTREAYPGIEDRSTMLESIARIERRLSQKLAEQQVENASERVRRLIEGVQNFAPHLSSEDYRFGMMSVPLSLVQEDARLLREIDPDTLFAEQEDEGRYYRDQFMWLRNLYLEAAERNEEILILIE
ncbi:MAG: hypothetical protein HC840_21675 [Leptolyngbyaceae cyanobacterium RM2_2_4]|nr:hypothetical protein [Leptolyngbyaceae cyanobacterium SM1_4_3]NJO51595.1 hypothetical protein [Leptolyngbyaceae cyanobacterium RM2_2_4]